MYMVITLRCSLGQKSIPQYVVMDDRVDLERLGSDQVSLIVNIFLNSKRLILY